MALFKSMNEKDKERLLGEVLAPGESYKVSVWSSIVMGTRDHYVMSTLSDCADTRHSVSMISDMYAYVGLTQGHLNLVIMSTMFVMREMNRLSIPLDAITRVDERTNALSGKVLVIHTQDAKLQLMLSDFTAERNDRAQKDDNLTLSRELMRLNYL